jgi:hypothetical protein
MPALWGLFSASRADLARVRARHLKRRVVRPIRSRGRARPSTEPSKVKARTPKTRTPKAPPPAAQFETKTVPAETALEVAPAKYAFGSMSAKRLGYVFGTHPSFAELMRSDSMKQVIDAEVNQRILSYRSVDTRDQPLPPMLMRKRDELVNVQAQLKSMVGPQMWSELCEATEALAQRREDIASGLGLPPEGIHPRYAHAAKALLKKATGVDVPPAELARCDEALAKEVLRSTGDPATTVRVFLNQFGIDARTAPRAFAALAQTAPSLSPHTLASLDALLAKPSAKNDTRLAHLVRTIEPAQLLLVQHRLADSGLIDDRLTFYGWEPSAQLARDFPRLTEAMASRDVRGEMLEPLLVGDPEYLRRFDRAGRLAGQTVEKARASRIFKSTDPTPFINWALLQDQKLRFLERESEPTPASVPLAERSIEQTFFDHLRARREGDLEKDLRNNYDLDLVFTENQGNFFGHEGVRHSAATLGKLVPGHDWVMNRLTFSPTGPTEGFATEIWSADAKDKLVTAVDNFYIKDGKILMQSAYYTNVREDLRREDHHHEHPELEGVE